MTTFLTDAIKEKTWELGLSDRQVALIIGCDTSNWSKTMRGLLPPPKYKEEAMSRLASLLELSPAEHNRYIIFWHLDRGELPDTLVNDETKRNKFITLCEE